MCVWFRASYGFNALGGNGICVYAQSPSTLSFYIVPMLFCRTTIHHAFSHCFRLISIRDVPAQDFINAYAQFLQRQGKLEVPGYVDIVKTSAGNELPPQESETWFYKRAASVARHIYLRKQVGVGKLNKLYGGAINRGFRPHRHADASGSINRKVVQALTKIGVLEHSDKGGRRISENGQRDLDRIAAATLEDAE